MNNFNDSGFASPSKGCSEAVEDSSIYFLVKSSNSALRHDTVFAQKEEKLAHRLRRKYPKKNMKKMLVWAQIRNHTGMKCVNPFLLPCGYIQSGTEVQIKEVTKTVYDYEMQLEDTKPYSKVQGSVFFISISDRENMRIITKVRYNHLRFRDICVFANVSQTYKEALASDYLFINVDYFTLRRTLAEGGATIDINEKPADLHKEVVLDVHVDKDAPATDGKTAMTMDKRNYSVASTSTAKPTNDADTAEKSAAKTRRKRPDFNKLTNKLWEKNAIYVFSKDVRDLTIEELEAERKECLIARAWCTLLGPEDRQPKKFEKSVKKLTKIQFSNNNVIARPVRFSKMLYELYDSIGLLKCDTVVATCFLVSHNMIVTNWHVVSAIETARRSSTPYNHNEVYVYFDFEHNAEKYSLANGHMLKEFSYEENVICEQLDYALLFLENHVEDTKALGEFVSCKVPEQGKVCIVGHPNGNEKQDEMCAILPLHEGRRSLELEKRFEENGLHCTNYPYSCTLSFAGQFCAHYYQSRLQELCEEEKAMTYDVNSMVSGASGAPVFDMKCNIVALHTGGFCLHGAEDKSIVEYGVTFKAIIQHLLTTVSPDFVENHFPYCLVEDMEFENSQ